MRIFFLLTTGSLFFYNCGSYKKVMLYKEDTYECGLHLQMRFDGFYTDTSIHNQQVGDRIFVNPLTPTFFYNNGSVARYPYLIENVQCLKTRYLNMESKHFTAEWGNYFIKGDTITIEYFRQTNPESNMFTHRVERIVEKGIIRFQKIRFFMQEDEKGRQQTLNKEMMFKAFPERPNQDYNWTRKKKNIHKSGASIRLGK
jgi:signal peptidase I